MKIKLSSLRAVIRKTILESYEAEERVYDDTVLPGEEADSDLLAEPDLTHQEDRDEYLDDKEKRASKKRIARLQSQEEIEEDMGDEHAIVGVRNLITPVRGKGKQNENYKKTT